MNIPQFMPFIGTEEYNEIADCFEKNWITEGPKAEELRKRICEMLHIPYAVFVSNGTVSLYLALKAINIQPGDEVIVPDMTFVASGNAVEMAGAVPIFCEVNMENFQIDVAKCDHLITEKTKAIMPVPLYGMAVNYDAVMAFAKRHKLLVVEDAAQAFAVTYKGKQCGTFGDVASFSFYADKIITTGEGGLLVTGNEEIHTRLQYLINHGRIKTGSFIHPENGYNFRMTDVCLAIGLAQFKKLDLIIRNKTRILNRYMEMLAAVEEVYFTKLEPGSTHIPFRVTIIAKEAHSLMEHMQKNGIGTRTFFYPLHKQPCFQKYNGYKHPRYSLSSANFPNSLFAYDNGLCLPTFPALKDEEIDYICKTIKEFYVKTK